MLFDEEITIIVQTDSTAPVQSVNGKIGFVSIDKSDVGLSNVENVSILGASGYLQDQINNLDISGGYATDLELNTTSGVLNQKINNLSGDTDNKFYLKSNPSGFLTGVDLSALYPRNNPSGFVTGVDTSNFYTKDNPSGFITGVDLSNYATTTNLNLTGSNLASNLATTGSTLSANLATTGSTLTTQINNLSGVSVLTYGNQTIDGTKTFRNSVYIHDLYVTGTEFIANVQNNFIESSYILLNLTGGAVDGGIFFVTGTGLTGVNDYGPILGFDHTDKFKFGIARRSDDLSTLNDIAAVQDITNYSGFVDNKYATITNLNLTGNNLETQINTISTKVIYTTGNQIKSGRLVIGDTILDTSNPYTLSLQSNNQDTFLEILNSGGAGKGGFVGMNGNNFELYNWQGGDIVFFTAENPSVGIERLYIKNDGKVGIGTSFPSEKLEVNGNIKASGASFTNRPTVNGNGLLLNGEAYPSNNPSGFITGVDLSSYITTSQTGNFYTNNNPSGFITGVDLSNYYTKDNPSGFITGVDTSNFYTKDNPSGFITNQNVVYTTGDQTISGVKTFTTGIDIFNGTSPQSLRIFNTTGTNSGEFGQIGWSGNTFLMGAFNTNSGIARNLELHSPLGRRLIIASNGQVGIGTSAGDQTSHGIWINPAAGQTSITHPGGQVFVNSVGVMFNSNTRVFNNNAFTFGTSQNNTTPMIRGVNVGSGFTSIQARLADNSNFVNFEANKLIANSGADIYFNGTAGTGVSGSHVGVLVSGLWNNTGQIYTGVRYNVTLGSGTSGLVPNTTNSLLNIAVNNTGVFNVNSKGQVLIQQLAGAIVYDNAFEVKRGNTTNYFVIRDDGATSFGLGGGQAIGFGGSITSAIRNGAIVTANGGFLGFSNSADPSNYLNEQTVRLYRGADFVLDLRNATYPTSGHQFRVFNATGTNSGEFGVFGWQVTGTVTGTGIGGSGITGNLSALVIGTRATQSGILRDVILTGRNIFLTPSLSGDTYIGTPNTGTNRIFLANPRATSYYQITPNQNSMTIGQIGGVTVVIDANFVNVTSNFSINGAGYLFRESTNGFIGLRDSYSSNNTVGTNNQGFNIYKIYSGAGLSREFLTLGWTGFTGIIGTRIGTSGTLRDLIITGNNININGAGDFNVFDPTYIFGNLNVSGNAALSGVIIPNPTAPTSTGSEGTRGQISWDNDFIYVCVSGNSWKRSALTTW